MRSRHASCCVLRMDTQTYYQPRFAQVDVSAAARLHLGFLDMSGSLGRRFGSLGLAVDAFPTRLAVRPADGVRVVGPGAERARDCALKLKDSLGISGGVRIELAEATPGHLGLGSGTQLCLAVGAAVATLYGLDLDAAAIAEQLGRGRRSGIGIGSFDRGGFLMDGGRGDESGSPPVTARLEFPERWRVVLLLDRRGEGLHGRGESEAFKRLPPFPPEQAAHLCRLAIMQILPALAEEDLAPFAAGIAEIQRTVGDHFAPAQGGRFTSPAVADALRLAEERGFAGVGQSSWGPTGFVLTEGEDEARGLIRELRRRFGELSPLNYRIAKGCNHPGRITHQPLVESLRSAL